MSDKTYERIDGIYDMEIVRGPRGNTVAIHDEADSHHGVDIENLEELRELMRQLKYAAKVLGWTSSQTKLEKLTIRARCGDNEAAKQLIKELAKDCINLDEDDGKSIAPGIGR